MSYCLACKNMDCINHGKNISISWECKDEKRMTNTYKVKDANTLDEMKDLIIDVITQVMGYEPADADQCVEEWLSK